MMEDELSYYFENHPEHEIQTPYFSNNDVSKSNTTDHFMTAGSFVDNRFKKHVIINEDIYYKEMYKLKDLVISIEKCDKIWETLKLIRNVQDIPFQEKAKKIIIKKKVIKKKLYTYDSMPKNLKYCTVKRNGRRMFQCNECGRDFIKFHSLRYHSFKVHTNYIAPLRKHSNSDFESRLSTINSSNNKLKHKRRFNEKLKQNESFQESKQTVLPIKIEKKSKIPESSKPIKLEVQTTEAVTCVLCKRLCKNIRKHIVEYHKILYPDHIVQECKAKDITTSKTKIKVAQPTKPKNFTKKKITDFSSSSFKNSLINQKRKFRRQKNWQNVEFNEFKCEFCEMKFNMKRCLANHLRIHKKDQNKCENIDIKQTSPVKDSLKKSFVEHSDNTEENSICECGRSFRNPHTLYLHRVKCKLSDGEDISYPRRNSSDRDSGIGISITIKKKNNSYEIVNKDRSTTNMETSSVNSCDIVSVSDGESEKYIASTITTKYSKDHSVLKLQIVDNDDEIDIEDDSQCNSDERNKVELSTDNKNLINDNLKTGHNIKEENKEFNSTECSIKNDENSMDIDKTNENITNKPFIPSLKELCRKSISGDDPHLSIEALKPKLKQKSKSLANNTSMFPVRTKVSDVLDPLVKHVDYPMLKARQRRNEQQCLCGKKFRSSYFLNLHVKKLHPKLLNCAYCETTFENFETYDHHNCDVIGKAKFEENSFKVSCPQCKEFVDFSNEKFDRHTMAQHFNPIVPFQCFVCCQRFENATLRRLHFSRHILPPCEICNKSMHYELQVKHNLYHQGIGYPCHKCKRAYSQKSILVKHRTKVHAQKIMKLVTCEICRKEMQFKSLKKHRYLHSVEYKCLKCGELQLGVPKLQLHIDKKHHGDYPFFKCQSCEMLFVLNKLLEKHIANGDCNKYNKTMKNELNGITKKNNENTKNSQINEKKNFKKISNNDKIIHVANLSKGVSMEVEIKESKQDEQISLEELIDHELYKNMDENFLDHKLFRRNSAKANVENNSHAADILILSDDELQVLNESKVKNNEVMVLRESKNIEKFIKNNKEVEITMYSGESLIEKKNYSNDVINFTENAMIRSDTEDFEIMFMKSNDESKTDLGHNSELNVKSEESEISIIC